MGACLYGYKVKRLVHAISTTAFQNFRNFMLNKSPVLGLTWHSLRTNLDIDFFRTHAICGSKAHTRTQNAQVTLSLQQAAMAIVSF